MKLPSNEQRLITAIDKYRAARTIELVNDSTIGKAGLARVLAHFEARLFRYNYIMNHEPEKLEDEIMSDFAGGMIDDESEAYKYYIKPIEHLIY